jgi:hypothetical protein
MKLLLRFYILTCLFLSQQFAYETVNLESNNITGDFLSRDISPKSSIISQNKAISVLEKASKSVLRGGTSGAIAGFIQVCTLMWLRTVVNYQYRYGKSIKSSIVDLYSEGGLSRFYQGLGYAIIQGPLARFGAVAANEAGQYLSSNVGYSTLIGTILASFWRVVLMPIDTCKTVLQVEGARGFQLLMKRV